ncbi:MAG TPA: YciI family protein [Burkholderiales bacterium]|nr:YciI family protein [Burkholderiales bacterium]
MPYAIVTKDKAGSANIRAEHRPAHVDYLKANQHLLLAAGALIDDDGTGGNGGILIVDTDDRKAAQRFIDDDPFAKAGLFEKVTVTRWRKAFFDKKCLI